MLLISWLLTLSVFTYIIGGFIYMALMEPLRMLGNFGSCFDTYRLTKHCCRPCAAFHANSIDGCEPFQRDKGPCHEANILQEWFKKHNDEFEVLILPLNPLKHLWDVLARQVHRGARYHSTVSGV